MEIEMSITVLHYGDVAVKAIPLLSSRMQQESAIAHILTALAQLSEQTIHQIIDEIPEQDKNQIVSLLCRENRDRILTVCNQFLKRKGTFLMLTDIQVDEQLDVCVEVGEIDYTGLIRTFLPIAQEHLASSSDAAAALLQKLPLNNADVFLRLMPQASKDAMAAFLLNANQEKLCALAERAAGEYGIRLSIENLNATI